MVPAIEDVVTCVVPSLLTVLDTAVWLLRRWRGIVVIQSWKISTKSVRVRRWRRCMMLLAMDLRGWSGACWTRMPTLKSLTRVDGEHSIMLQVKVT